MRARAGITVAAAVALLGAGFAQQAGAATRDGTTGGAATRDGSVSASAARSTEIWFTNNTGCELRLANADLDHGIWTVYPLYSISPGGGGHWMSESDGFMTGTEGRVRYNLFGGCENKVLRIHWNNPYVGSNSYDCDDSSSGIRCGFWGGSGNNAVVTVTADQA
ncbi:aegerolysin family protein [Spirillospora sp. NPDC052269]